LINLAEMRFMREVCKYEYELHHEPTSSKDIMVSREAVDTGIP
jgi:hypothetical protein